MYGPTTIFWIVLALFSVGLFPLLCFLPREVPLAFVVKLVWWCWILLTFACLESFWFLHQIWRRVMLGRVALVVVSSLSSLWIYHAIPFWLVKFLLRNQLTAWWEFPCTLFAIFPLLLLIFYLSLIFVNLVTMCLSVFLLGFILPRTLCAFWTWLVIFFPMLQKFSAIISSNIFSGPFSLSSPSGPL